MSIAWGRLAAPFKGCCDHEQWKLSCLSNEQARKAGRLKPWYIDWAVPEGKCTCGDSPGRLLYDQWRLPYGDLPRIDHPYISDLATTATKSVGGSTVHADGGYASLGLLVQSRKTVTLVHRGNTASVVFLADCRLRL
jgi:hypothetical protein